LEDEGIKVGGQGVCPTISLACIIFKVGGGSPFVSIHDFQATEAHRPDR
jgi:hypothetical protein